MKARYLVLLALLAYALGLVVAMPAATALNWAPPVPISGVEGRVLVGRAATVQVGAQRLEDLHWRFSPAALLSARVGAAVDFSFLDGRGQGLLALDWQRDVHLSDARLGISAASLAQALEVPFAEFDGDIEVRIDSARWRQQQLADLAARLVWRQAAVSQPVDISLGEVEAQISREADDRYVARIQNSGGAVAIDGEIRLNGQRLQSDIRLRPLAGAPAELGDLLAGVGRRQSDGSYRLQRNANLRDLF